jgi:TonB family protein
MDAVLLRHFGLREQPFGVTPDPRFLFESRTHREALASLLYGLSAERGFLALLGKPGMGKTTLLFHLLERFRHTARTAFLFQTQCDSREFFGHLCSDLDIERSTPDDMVLMHRRFNEALENEARQGRRCIIVIDEAHNLENNVLETIRLLSDFETPRSKLLQIIIAGQPPLQDTLAHPSMAQLRQRVSMICRLTPLAPEEVSEYICHRMRTAGASGDTIFTAGTRARIAALSEGIPRVISNICFNAMSLAFATGQREITPEIVNEVALDLDLTATQLSPLPAKACDSEDVPQVPEFVPPGVVEDESAHDLRPAPASVPAIESKLPNAISESGTHASHLPPRERTVAPTAAVRAETLKRHVPPREQHRLNRAPQRSRNSSRIRILESAAITLAICAVVVALGLSAITRHADRAPASNAPALNTSWNRGAVQAAPPEEAPAGSASGETGQSIGSMTSKGNLRSVEKSGGAAAKRNVPEQDPSGEHSNLVIHMPARERSPVRQQQQPIIPAPEVDAKPNAPSITAWVGTPKLAPKLEQTPPGLNVASSSPPIIGHVIRMVKPTYPEAAKSAAIQGVVTLRASVDGNGKVQSVQVLDGNPALTSAASHAVKQWRYRPYIPGNGSATPFQTVVRIRFVLGGT